MPENPLLPMAGQIERIITETPDVKTFHVTFTGGKPFVPRPGQLAMVSLPAVGEGMFSISSQGEQHLEFSIKKAGMLTAALHEAETGQMVGVRGPYGNGFPLDLCRGKDLLFIGGGIGLAPLRSMIVYCLAHRSDFGHIQIIYGARSPADLVFKEEIFDRWPHEPDTEVNITVDVGDDNWQGHVGFVPAYLEELNPDPAGKVTVTCGPPIMIKFVLQALDKMRYAPENIVTTLEMRMKCGIGKCGRCNIGSSYVCLDGPVFTLAQLQNLPDEY
ncbi:MAG: hydrogenase [Clostridia bacterium]|nr:MAG: hydrogenase [Clostridia bacterium]